MMSTAFYECPYGIIEIVAASGRLIGVRLGERGSGEQYRLPGTGMPPGIRVFTRYLDAYFEHRPERFELALADLSSATDMQQRIYRALMQVGFGRTISYGELAKLSGFKGAARAVGRCLGENPVPIFIPCHRVVRADGRLGGFSEGLEWKRCLLRHEGWAVKGDRIGSCERNFS